MKKLLKEKAVSVFKKFLNHEEVEWSLDKKIKESTQTINISNSIPSPYYKYEDLFNVPSHRDDVVFITGRFRSGSSVFWNIFRVQPECTAYYEPFNERRWFDNKVRGNFVDTSHIGITDYWTEYNGLEQLSSFYEASWIDSALHMDENSYNTKMRSFIDTLIINTGNRPVLQFNRIDFRLPWLRKNYPYAKFLHIYRNPRDQWLSFLSDKILMNANDVAHTYKDAFYLDVWCKDLVKQFPFLSKSITPHPYMRFYYLWKLSLIYGINYCDLSFSLESFVSNPRSHLEEIKELLDWKTFDVSKSVDVIQHIETNKWESYADSEWFSQKERLCEIELNNFFGC